MRLLYVKPVQNRCVTVSVLWLCQQDYSCLVLCPKVNLIELRRIPLLCVYTSFSSSSYYIRSMQNGNKIDKYLILTLQPQTLVSQYQINSHRSFHVVKNNCTTFQSFSIADLRIFTIAVFLCNYCFVVDCAVPFAMCVSPRLFLHSSLWAEFSRISFHRLVLQIFLQKNVIFQLLLQFLLTKVCSIEIVIPLEHCAFSCSQ